MHGRLWGVAPVVLLLAMALAGCMQQGPHFESAGATEVSAKRNADLAASAAKAWDPAGKLVAVGGGETTETLDDAVPADPDVGNGLAVTWTYVYQTADGKSRAFEVSADGTVVSKNESEAMDDYGSYAGGYAAAYQSYRTSQSGSDAKPIKNWTWDSDAALAAAMKNESFRAAARAPNATLAEALGNAGVPDAWVFVASAEETTVIAAVNATSGELVAVHDLSRYSWQDAQVYASGTTTTAVKASSTTANRTSAPPVHVHQTGDLTPSSATETIKFHLAAPESGNLNLTMSPNGDVTSFGWKLVQGEKTLRYGTGDFGTMDSRVRLGLKDGDYALVLDMSYVQGAVPLAKVSYDLKLDLVPSS